MTSARIQLACVMSVLMLTVFLAGCSGGSSLNRQLAAQPSSAEAEQLAYKSGSVGVGMDTKDSGDGEGREAGDRVWWVDPETGAEGWITEGYATIGLDFIPEWILNPPADCDFYNDLFINDPTIQALMQLGFELLFPYGIIGAGEFKLPPGMTFEQTQIMLMEGFPNIAFVDPWAFREPLSYPNDPWLYSGGGPSPNTYQWYFENTDLPYDVNAPPGWTIQRGNSNVVMAVVDTGVARNLPDIGASRLTEYGWNVDREFPPEDYDTIITEGGGYPYAPPYYPESQMYWSHGTMVTSLAVSSTNNFQQMAGGTWAGKALPINVQSPPPPFDAEMSDEWITHALYMLLDQVDLVDCEPLGQYPHYNIKVVNLSIGGPIRNIAHSILIWLLSFKTVVVTSAGNHRCLGNPYIYPAASERLLAPWQKNVRADTALCVTSFDKYGDHSWFASFYDPLFHDYNWVDVSAPGSAILVLNPADLRGWSSLSGTSFSAPITSSLALLMACEYPKMSSWAIHDAIKTYTRSDPPLNSAMIPERIDYELALSMGMR